MKSRKLRTVLAVWLWVAASAGGAAGLQPQPVVQAIREEANAFREEQGREALARSDALAQAAQRFARYMARTGRYGHQADGRRPAERAEAQGYERCIVAENIAMQYRSDGFDSAGALAGRFMQGWRESPGHRENLLDPDVTQTGVGIARDDEGRYFAVQLFGRPKSDALRFTIENRSGEATRYVAGGKEYALPPRASRTHMLCRPGQIRVPPEPQPARFEAAIRDGARYVVREERVAVSAAD